MHMYFITDSFGTFHMVKNDLNQIIIICILLDSSNNLKYSYALVYAY